MLLEDYGLIGDMQSAALVGRDGCVDWLCLPRFDSPSCFTALLGDERHGRWLVAPAGEVRASSRRYRPGTLVLETEFEVAEGAVRVIDFMPRRGDGPPRLMRIVEGVRGRVPMRMELSLRPDYAAIKPWVDPAADGAVATAGPDAFRLSTPLPLQIEDGSMTAEFVAVKGARERLTLTWHLSYEEAPPVEDADSALARTEAWWQEWSGRCSYQGAYRDEVLTSLIALKAMTSETTGAVIAAPTTSLPEDLGGVRNWDYRYCWLRDSVLTLEALLAAGYADEALAFRDFLVRVGTGDPTTIQITQNLQWLLLMGVSFTVSVFLQTVRGYNAIETGVIFTAATLGVLASSLAAERLAKRRPQRTLIMAGFVVTAAGIGLLLALVGASSRAVAFAPGLLLIGLGLGVMLTPSVNLVQSSFPEQQQGEISGLSRSVSNLGSSFGTAIAGTILVSNLASGNTTYVIAMVVLACLALVGLAAAMLLPAHPDRRHTPLELAQEREAISA
jgi:GH15 family glucan-1,4-alpha-glucosidase